MSTKRCNGRRLRNRVWFLKHGAVKTVPCFWCQKTLTFNEATVDHLKAKADGGKNNLENLVISCPRCNHKRGSATSKKCNYKSKMAYFYLTTIQCKTALHARHLANKYHGQILLLDDEKFIHAFTLCRLTTNYQEEDSKHFVDILPRIVTENALGSPGDTFKADQYCNIIYGYLKNDRYFECACTAVECSFFELPEKDDFHNGWNGLIVSNQIYNEKYKEVKLFQNFSETHMWIPKETEKL